MDADARPRLADVHCEAGTLGQYVLVASERPFWATVTASGLAIAQLCDGCRTVREIAGIAAARLPSLSSLPAAQALFRVLAFLEDLARHGLVHTPGAPADRWAWAESVPLAAVFVEITDQCNLACKHCYLGKRLGRGAGLDTPSLKTALLGFRALGVESVVYSGGEPLLRRDWQELVCWGATVGFEGTLLTNGTLVTPEVVSVLERVGLAVQVSLDAPNAGVHDRVRGLGAFDDALYGIRLLLESRLRSRVSLSCTVSALNATLLPALCDIAVDLGLPRMGFGIVQRAGRAETQWDELGLCLQEQIRVGEMLESLKAGYGQRLQIAAPGCVAVGDGLRRPGTVRGCPVGSTPAVDADGHVFGCQLFIDTPHAIGDLRCQSPAEIMEGEPLKRLREAIAARSTTVPSCAPCVWRSVCQGGCAARGVRNCGMSLNDPDPLCEGYRYAFRRASRAFPVEAEQQSASRG